MKTPRLGLIALFLAQFALFWQYANREIVWAYPANFDQSTYLSMGYGLYQEVLQEGLFPALLHYFRQPHPTGLMLPLQDCAVQLFFGSGRSSALLVNFGYFVLLEVVLFTTARRLTGRAAFGWIGCGLLMMQQSLFASAGGFFDCRIDPISSCLYGTFVCLAVQATVLRERRWLVAAVGCALLMVSFRFITFGYLVGFCLTLLTLLAGLRLFWRGGRMGAAILKRATQRTIVLGLSLALVCGPLLALHWKAIHDYYVVGHMTGNEKHIRAVEAGITSFGGHLTFYLGALVREHLGAVFVAAWLTLAVSALVARFAVRGRSVSSRWLVQLGVVGASLFSPWFILTLDESKSRLVIDVLDAPVALLFVVLAAARPVRVPGASPDAAVREVGPWRGWGWSVAATAAVVLGGFNWLTHLARQGPFSARRASAEQIETLYDLIGDESDHLGIKDPRIAADVIFDWVLPSSINVAFYEHHGRWLNAQASLGVGIFAVPREDVFAKLAASDFALISTFPKEGTYPFYDSIRPLSGEITRWCESHLLPLRTFEIDGSRVTVYARSNIPVEGVSGGWITTDGVRVRLPGAVLDAWRAGDKNFLVFEGGDQPGQVPQVPTASVRLMNPNGQPGSVVCPAEYLRPTPGTYRIRIDLRPLRGAVPPGADATLDLRLEHAFFVPKDVGINEDTRQLVAMAPVTNHFE